MPRDPAKAEPLPLEFRSFSAGSCISALAERPRTEPHAIRRRWAKMIALQIVDALSAQRGGIFGVLDAFGHRVEAKALGQAQQVTEEDLVFGPVCQVSNKGTIDL